MPLSQYGVWAGSRLWPNVATPRSGRSTSGQTKPVAAITSSTSKVEFLAARTRPARDHERPIVAPDDALGCGVEDRHAATQHVVLDRLDVAGPDPDERSGVDRQLGRRRRGDDDPARPVEQAGGQLEPGVLLADDVHALVRIRVGRPRVGVVRGVLDPRRPRPVGLGDTDRDHERPGPVLPVGRLDDERRRRAFLATRARPAAAVPDRDPRRAPRSARGSPPSRAARESTTSPSMRSGMIARCSGSSARRLFQS